MEAFLNFKTMVIELTGLPIANASLLDESTVAAEAMAMAFSLKGKDMNRSFFVSNTCHPQTIDVIKTRSEPLGIQLIIGDHQKLDIYLFLQHSFNILQLMDLFISTPSSFIKCNPLVHW